MNMKLLAVALAALAVTAGGTAAVDGTVQQESDEVTANDAAVDAVYTNGTATVTVTNAGEPVTNATVKMRDREYPMPPNGTVSADIDVMDGLDIEVEGDGFEAEQKYRFSGGELTLVEEEYEYEEEEDEDEDEAEEKDEDD